MLENYKDILTFKDLKAILPLGDNKIYELLRKKEIPNTEIGGKYIILKSAPIKFLETAA